MRVVWEFRHRGLSVSNVHIQISSRNGSLARLVLPYQILKT